MSTLKSSIDKELLALYKIDTKSKMWEEKWIIIEEQLKCYSQIHVKQWPAVPEQTDGDDITGKTISYYKKKLCLAKTEKKFSINYYIKALDSFYLYEVLFRHKNNYIEWNLRWIKHYKFIKGVIKYIIKQTEWPDDLYHDCLIKFIETIKKEKKDFNKDPFLPYFEKICSNKHKDEKKKSTKQPKTVVIDAGMDKKEDTDVEGFLCHLSNKNETFFYGTSRFSPDDKLKFIDVMRQIIERASDPHISLTFLVEKLYLSPKGGKIYILDESNKIVEDENEKFVTVNVNKAYMELFGNKTLFEIQAFFLNYMDSLGYVLKEKDLKNINDKLFQYKDGKMFGDKQLAEFYNGLKDPIHAIEMWINRFQDSINDLTIDSNGKEKSKNKKNVKS